MQLTETRKTAGQGPLAKRSARGGRGSQGGQSGGCTCGGHHGNRNARHGNRARNSIGSGGSRAHSNGASTNSQPNSCPSAERLLEKCHRCKQRGHQWRKCIARIILAPAQTQAEAAMISVPGDLGDNVVFVVQAMSDVCYTGTDERTTNRNGLEKLRVIEAQLAV